MGSDESHFNVSVGSDGQSHKTVSTDHNLLLFSLWMQRKRSEPPFPSASLCSRELDDDDDVELNVLGYRVDKLTSACSWFSVALRPQKP